MSLGPHSQTCTIEFSTPAELDYRCDIAWEVEAGVLDWAFLRIEATDHERLDAVFDYEAIKSGKYLTPQILADRYDPLIRSKIWDAIGDFVPRTKESSHVN